MKIKYYLVLLLTAVSFGQPKSEKKVDSKTKEVVLKPTVKTTVTKPASKPDTVKVVNLSTTPTAIPVDKAKNTQVVIVKDIGKEDYSKYIISIISLLVGFFLNKMYEWWNDRKKIRKSGKRWINEIRSLEESINAQIEALELLDSNLKADSNAVPNLSIYSVLNGNVFKSLDKNDLMNYIEQKNSKKWYKKLFTRTDEEKLNEFKTIVKISNKVHGFISRLETYYEQIGKRHESFSTGKSALTTALAKNLQEWLKAFAIYGVELERQGADLKTDPRYKPIANLYIAEIKPYLQNANFHPEKLRDNFFMPIIGILANFRLDPLIKDLAESGTACLHSIKGIEMEMYYIATNLETLIGYYKELLEDINPIIDLINGKKSTGN
jgi:hypothetical protein